ncbi:hypothetical protein AOX56_00240 [Aeromonas sobria]|jgi:hypothetical protein|uniref:Uncharacterized protein n=1 Tax=Aeromonas sobria TaxID=646 RepID=A0A2N3J8W8_AERSO|nr:hypothetical protein [Aeromonas sobria]PKQ82987.1 hypothetical protein AOX56_00240 [Aeromonas sobria]
MQEEDLAEFKKKFMGFCWTEELHYALKDLSSDDAKKLVESMSVVEIDRKVNIRRHQEDYIADYIEYLWEVSETAYWKHIIVSLRDDVGLLWSDNMSHVERMCNNEIPDDVLEAVLLFICEICERDNMFDFEALSEVIKSQVNDFSNRHKIESFANRLSISHKKMFLDKIELMLSSEEAYRFKS